MDRFQIGIGSHLEKSARLLAYGATAIPRADLPTGTDTWACSADRKWRSFIPFLGSGGTAPIKASDPKHEASVGSEVDVGAQAACNFDLAGTSSAGSRTSRLQGRLEAADGHTLSGTVQPAEIEAPNLASQAPEDCVGFTSEDAISGCDEGLPTTALSAQSFAFEALAAAVKADVVFKAI